jgi:hypothetical protein
MPSEKNPNCERCGVAAYLTNGVYAMENCPLCFPTIEQSSIVAATVKEFLTVEPVSNHYKFNDGDVHLCWACGALPCDGGLQSWEKLPWVVTLKESGGWRFLIDSRDPENSDMFSGFKINNHGKIMAQPTLTTGSGGRLNLHRSYFEEVLPS